MKAGCTLACSEHRPGGAALSGAASTGPLAIEIDKIRIGDRLRGIDESAIELLRSSILDRGLIHAITVRADPDNPGLYLLVAGRAAAQPSAQRGRSLRGPRRKTL